MPAILGIVRFAIRDSVPLRLEALGWEPKKVHFEDFWEPLQSLSSAIRFLIVGLNSQCVTWLDRESESTPVCLFY